MMTVAGPDGPSRLRALLVGWFSFWHGEVTAGDVLALRSVTAALVAAGLDFDTAWSPGFRPGKLRLEDARPEHYSHLIFICGPVHGEQVALLHKRFACCQRIAVGVSVIDAAHPAVTGFDIVLARDGPGTRPVRDLAAAAPPDPVRPTVPVAGIALASGQGEYGDRRRHDAVTSQLTGWLGGKACALVPVETRLDIGDWRLCSTAEAVTALIARLDLLVTTRLHGLVLALRAGLPALAVDPVAGGGKVTAQARAWHWPALLAAEHAADRGRLDVQWDWCLSQAGRRAARAGATQASQAAEPLLAALLGILRDPPARN